MISLNAEPEIVRAIERLKQKARLQRKESKARAWRKYRRMVKTEQQRERAVAKRLNPLLRQPWGHAT